MKIFLSRSWDLAAFLVSYLCLCGLISYIGQASFSLILPFDAIRHFGFTLPNWFMYSIFGCGLLVVILTTLNPFKFDKKAYGSAKFATEKDIQKFGLRDNQGLIFGVRSGRYIRSDASLSAMLYAPPGSGKTQGVVVPSLVSSMNSVIIHDPKGELYTLCASYRSHLGRVIRFSPGEANSAAWNPLGAHELPQSWAAISTHVERVCNAVIRPQKDTEEGSHWILTARQIFSFWALYLIFKNPEQGTSMPAILKAASTGDPKESIEKILMLDDEVQGEIAKLQEQVGSTPELQSTIDDLQTQLLPERIRTEGNQIVAKEGREFASVVSTFYTTMKVFLDERVAKNTSTPTEKEDRCNLFKLSDLRKERTSIFLTVATADQERLKPIISLFFEFAVMTLISEEPTEEDHGVTLILDEFVRLSKLDEVIRLPEIGRSYRVNAIFVCQSISQIVKIYGQAGADSLKNTTHLHVVFSQNEPRVAEELSKAIGQKTRKRHSKSTSSRDIHHSTSESAEGVALITPQQIMSMPKGQVLMLVQNHFETPIKANAAFWFKDGTLKKALGCKGL